MVKKFQSQYRSIMGYPAPSEKWTETDLWEWVDAGMPGNPPWNPEGVQPATAAGREAIIDASGNRAVYEAYKAGREGSLKSEMVAYRESYGKRTQEEYKKAVNKRRLMWAAGIGVAALALLGFGS